MTNIFIVKWKTLHSSSSPVKVAFRSSSPCTQWKLACKLKYDKILPKHSLTDTAAVTRDLHETGSRTWAATGWHERRPGWRPRRRPCSCVLRVCGRKCWSWSRTHVPGRQNAQMRGTVQSGSKCPSWPSIRAASGEADDTPPEPQKQRRETCFPFSLWDSLPSSRIYVILSIFCHEPPQNPVNRFKYMLMCED